MVDRERGLDQAGDARRALGVAELRLHRAERTQKLEPDLGIGIVNHAEQFPCEFGILRQVRLGQDDCILAHACFLVSESRFDFRRFQLA